MATLTFETTLQKPRYQVHRATGPFAGDEAHDGIFSALNFRLVKTLHLWIAATGTTDTAGALSLKCQHLDGDSERLHIAGVQGMKDATPKGGTGIDATWLAVTTNPNILYLGGTLLRVFPVNHDTLLKIEPFRIGDIDVTWGVATTGNFSFDHFTFLTEFAEK